MAKLSAARNKSRRFLVQALYQAQMAEVELSEIVNLFQEDHNMKRADLAFFKEVITGISDNYTSLVNSIEQIGHRPFSESGPIEKGILLIGSFELSYKGDIPFQNAVNLVRGVGNNLGNVVHGFRGFPEVASPYPTVQPGMDPPRMPIPVPADVETIYKTAQTNVGAIGSA